MMRERMTAAVRNAAEKMNYAFRTGFDYRINPVVTEFPTVWMSPPKLVGMKGRNEGCIEYKVKLYMLAAGAEKTADEKETVWIALERDAVTLLRELENGGLTAGVSGLECVPGEFSLTNHGELSLEVTFRIGMMFCMCDS